MNMFQTCSYQKHKHNHFVFVFIQVMWTEKISTVKLDPFIISTFTFIQMITAIHN